MNVSIVIPNWNGAEKLQKHLPAVLKSARHSTVAEIIVVDDKSTDQSVEIIKRDFPDVKLVQKDKNTGFSSNVNLGVKSSSGDFIVLLNSDVSPEENFLDEALPHFKDQKVFAVGCNSGGGWSRAEFRNGFFWHSQVDSVDKEESHQTLWVSGGSGIFRKSIWEELQGLDNLFDPFYEEDLDLGYRATKRGYINIWEPKSRVEHYHQGVTSGKKEVGVIKKHFSSEKIARIAQRNQLIFTWKNITSSILTAEHKKALGLMLIKHPKYWQVFLSALVTLPQILEKRKVEEREAKLTDEEVLSMFSSF
ncbi:glycosyltransferase family 2 protein [Candidatus Daviesbacteria bacterium]|nr:glycosyltransferase family 2 protein [Candidatus Daviesbacteria bacterium]